MYSNGPEAKAGHKACLESRLLDEREGRGGAKNRRNFEFEEIDYYLKFKEWPFGEPVAVTLIPRPKEVPDAD